MKAYKAFWPDMTCRGFQYEIGQTYEMDEKPHVCKRGFHACRYIEDTLRFYLPYEKPIICEVELLGDLSYTLDETKIATNKIRIVRKLTRQEIIDHTMYYHNNTQKPHAYLLVAYCLTKYTKLNLPDEMIATIPAFVQVNLSTFGPARIIPQLIRVAEERTKMYMIQDAYKEKSKNKNLITKLLKHDTNRLVQMTLVKYEKYH